MTSVGLPSSFARPSESQPPLGRRLWLTLTHPPLRDPRFWATQGLVIVIAVGHDWLEAFGYLPSLGKAYFLPISMFFIPVVFAALYFGLRGSLATGIWCTVISMPNWLFFHKGSEQVGVIFQLLIVDGIAVFVGYGVDQQMKARAAAEQASQALRASEARYRGLFETSGEAVLVVDAGGVVLDSNAAAADLFGGKAGQLRGSRLESLLGTGREANASETTDARRGILIVNANGRRTWIEPVSSPLEDQSGLRQVLLRDVTEQQRREVGLQTYAAEVVRGQEEERKRIAQELHDDTVQSLVLLWRRLDGLAANHAEDSSGHVPALLEARDTAGAIADSVRAYARGLRPPILDDLGLTPAIRRLASELDARSPMSADLAVRGEDHRLPSDVELALFRIAQEALHNAEKHSTAAAVRLVLDYGADATTLTIRDNGRGFKPSLQHEFAASGKLGLVGMQERARIVGGKLSIRSRESGGTSVIAKVPEPPGKRPGERGR